MFLNPTSDLKIVVFVSDIWQHACPYLRITELIDLAGWELIQGVTWEHGEIKIFPEKTSDADLVIIQRDFPKYQDAYNRIVEIAEDSKTPIIYELDDLLTELPQNHPDLVRYQSIRTEILAAIARADGIICPTKPLREYLLQFNHNVWVFPNMLDDRVWKFRDPGKFLTRADERVVIGYQGTNSHAPDIAIISPILLKLLDTYHGRLGLRFWGAPPPVELVNRENVQYITPGIVYYPEFVSQFMLEDSDIFIAPLQDTPFNNCKSSIKYLEYSALGVPGVYSNVIPYREVVTHKVNGMLASNLDEWEAGLIELIEHPDLRYQMGAAAQATVRQGWQLTEHSGEWKQIIQQLLANKSNTRPDPIITHLVKKYSAWDQQIQAQNQDLQGSLSAVRNEVVQHQERINALENDLDTLQQEVNQRSNEVEDKSNEIAERDVHISKLVTHISILETQLANTNQTLHDITHSRGWVFLEKLYWLRLKLIPRGSQREAFARKLFVRVKNILKPAPKVHPQITPQVAQVQPDQPDVSAQPDIQFLIALGEPCPTPSIGIIYHKHCTDAGEQEVLDWLDHQSLHTTDIVIWDESNHLVWFASNPEHKIEAPNIFNVCRILNSRYICFATNYLVLQAKTYLEVNLTALETESLAFTCNTLGVSNLQDNMVPVTDNGYQMPLQRMVVRKELFTEDAEMAINLSNWMQLHQDGKCIVGKWINHTSNEKDNAEYPDRLAPLIGAEIIFHGNYILAKSSGRDNYFPITQPIKPVESVLPVAIEESDKPTVLIVMPFLAVGGAEQHLLLVMRSLSEKFRFVVLTIEYLDPNLGTTTNSFQQITPYVYNLPDYLHNTLLWSYFTWMMERFSPAAIWIPNGVNWIYQVLPEIKRLYPQVRIVNMVYDALVGWINRYDKMLVEHLDGHIGVNSKICQAYILRGSPPEKVYLIENGIDPLDLIPDNYSPDRILSIKQNLKIPVDKKIVTFASRIHQQKRPLDFVELARRFKDDSSVAFLMVGDGPLAGEVDEQAAHLGLNNFYRSGFYRPISDIWAITDVFVLPSEFEGMPMVIIECMAMGKPVVVTNVGNNYEVVNQTGGGVVTQRIGDISALMSGVIKMLQEPPDPKILREVTLAHYDIHLVAEKYRVALLGN